MTAELVGKIGHPAVVDLGNFTANEIPDDLPYTFVDGSGQSRNLVGAAAIILDYQVAGVPPAVSYVATLVDAANGKVGYTWTPTSMSTPGHYEGQFWVTDAGGKVFASPVIRWYVATAIKAP